MRHRNILLIAITTTLAVLVSVLPFTPATPAFAVSRPTLSVHQHSKTTIDVKWKGGKTKGTVTLAANKPFTQYKRTKRAVKRHVRVTVPWVLRAGTGRQIYLRVTAGRTSKIVWTILRTSSPSGHTLTVASYNTCLACSAKHSWGERRSRVAASIRKANADIIGIQEATTGENGRFADIRNSVRSAGYEFPYDDDVVYHPSSYMSPDRVSAADSYSRNAQLLYKPSKLERLDGGVLAPAELPGAASALAWSHNANYRKWFAWGKFRQWSTRKTFVAVSVHLPVGKNAAARTIRVNVLNVIQKWLNRVAPGLPIVFVGDFNSTYERDPSDAEVQMSKNYGFTEAASAPQRSLWNLRFSTSNRNAANGKYDGFPPKVFQATYAGQRIDYIFAKRIKGFRSYQTQIVRTHGLTFNKQFQGSDHNLIKAALVL